MSKDRFIEFVSLNLDENDFVDEVLPAKSMNRAEALVKEIGAVEAMNLAMNHSCNICVFWDKAIYRCTSIDRHRCRDGIREYLEEEVK